MALSRSRRIGSPVIACLSTFFEAVSSGASFTLGLTTGAAATRSGLRIRARDRSTRARSRATTWEKSAESLRSEIGRLFGSSKVPCSARAAAIAAQRTPSERSFWISVRAVETAAVAPVFGVDRG
jgi:hypothetical protein